MAEELYDEDFPNLRQEGFRRSSEPGLYNCLAFAIGDEENCWWPSRHPQWSDNRWPAAVPNEVTLEAIRCFLALEGFSTCPDGHHEPGFVKVALYALGADPTHIARQYPDGTCRSKLGATEEDIEHTLSGLEGPAYGTVVAFMKRTHSEESS